MVVDHDCMTRLHQHDMKVTLHLSQVYPYGNGQLSGTKIACQHGADECEGNKIIACMQNQYAIHGQCVLV